MDVGCAFFLYAVRLMVVVADSVCQVTLAGLPCRFSCSSASVNDGGGTAIPKTSPPSF